MKMDLKLLSEKLHELDKHKIIDVSIREQIEKYILQLQQGILRELSWASFSSFWPPRLIKAYKEDNLGCFFGAGISIPCGLPSWNDLLNNYFELDKVFLADKDLAYNPLTLADIASHNIGADKVQTIIRNSFKKEKMPSVSHYMLASLRLPVYITTNYDNLFESHKLLDATSVNIGKQGIRLYLSRKYTYAGIASVLKLAGLEIVTHQKMSIGGEGSFENIIILAQKLTRPNIG